MDRAPVNGQSGIPRGTISWAEHFEIWKIYDSVYNNGRSALDIAENGGFGYYEAEDLLGHMLMTWAPRDVKVLTWQGQS